MAKSMTKVGVDESETPIIVDNKEVVKSKKKYDPDDLIPCRSICNGEYLLVGDKTNELYSWADYGTVEYIPYQDVKYLCDRRNIAITTPRIIIEDDELLSAYPYITEIYESMYSKGDLMSIIDLPVRQMKDAINNLPAGALSSLKGLVSTMIERKQIDSVEKIETLDEIFGTQLLLALAKY